MSHTLALRFSARGLRRSPIRFHTHSVAALFSTSQGSINHDEIAHFSKLSSQWWDERGEFSFLHKMNPVRMQFIADKLLEVSYDDKPDTEFERSQVLKGLDVLDVGCGGGLLSEVCFFDSFLTPAPVQKIQYFLLRVWLAWGLILWALMLRNPTLLLPLYIPRPTQNCLQ